MRPAIFDLDVLAFDKSRLAEATPECGGQRGKGLGRGETKIADYRHCGLLRASRKRPRRRAADQRDEIAPLHSITSSATASSVGGMARPSAFAVLRLITNSNLVGCMTGRSAGFSPLSIRPA